MTRENQFHDTAQSGEKIIPSVFEDLIEPDPLVRPWMKPFLPEDPAQRDLVMFIISTFFGGMIGLLFVYVNEFAGMILGGVTTAHFYYKYLWRRTKRAARKNERR